MKIVLVVAVAFAIIATGSGRKIKFTECGANGVVQSVDVVPCNEEPCTFTKGEQVKMTAAFVPKEKVQSATLNVVIDMEGIEVEYPDIETDLCKKVNCPLEAGKQVEASYDITAEDFFPDMFTDMKWEAKDNNDKVVFCAIAKVGIKS